MSGSTFRFGHIDLRRLVFRETFTGDGSATTFQLAGPDNATFAIGAWASANIQSALPAHVTNATTKKPIYDSLIPISRNRIGVSSISAATGIATLNYAPRNGVLFYIFYWYELSGRAYIEDYYREDFVASMESDTLSEFNLPDTNSSNLLTLIWNEDDTADRTLNILVGGADRSLTIDENIQASLIINQGDVDDTPVEGVTTAPVSSGWAYGHVAAADPHAGYVKESEFTAADTVLVGTGVSTLGAVTLAASQFLAKKAAGVATNVTATEARAILNVEDGAEVNNISDINATDLTDGGDTTLHDHDGISENTGARHTQGTDVALGAVGTKNPPVDEDKAIYRDSTASDALVTSTWTQVKAFLKTYFDGLYNLYVHPNHSGNVTSVADGATTIAAKAVTVAMLADGTDGQLITWDADGVAATVAVGTATHVLTSNGAGVAPTFQAATGGGIADPGASTDHALLRWNGATGDAVQDSTIIVDDSGRMTNPSQPAFLVYKSADQNNLPLNTENTIIWQNEVYDQGSNFASNTFTAPIDGRYSLSFVLKVNQIDLDTSYYVFRLVTSNRTISYLFFPAAVYTTDTGDSIFMGGFPFDMDASDTAYVVIFPHNSGVAQLDVQEGGGQGSYFGGFLIC